MLFALPCFYDPCLSCPGLLAGREELTGVGNSAACLARSFISCDLQISVVARNVAGEVNQWRPGAISLLDLVTRREGRSAWGVDKLCVQPQPFNLMSPAFQMLHSAREQWLLHDSYSNPGATSCWCLVCALLRPGRTYSIPGCHRDDDVTHNPTRAWDGKARTGQACPGTMRHNSVRAVAYCVCRALRVCPQPHVRPWLHDGCGCRRNWSFSVACSAQAPVEPQTNH